MGYTEPMNTAPKYKHKPDDIQALVQWQLLEEKGVYSRDKELLIILIGAGAAILAVITETYIFALLVGIATGMFVYIGRQNPKKHLFTIADIGVFLDDDFLSFEEIHGFNIIDDPGARARLILKIQKIIYINEIVPIYDVQIDKIEHALKEMNIPKDETLRPNLLDRITLSV